MVQRFLGQNLPFLDVQAILASGRTVGVIGLIGLIFTGIGWVEAIRSSQRLIWRLNQHPGYFGVRQALDLLVLIGVLLLIAVSVLAVAALESLLQWATGGHASFVLSVVSWALTVGHQHAARGGAAGGGAAAADDRAASGAAGADGRRSASRC